MILTYLNHNHRIFPYPNWFLSFPDICSRWSKQTKNDSTIPCGFPISIMQISHKKTCNKKEPPEKPQKIYESSVFSGFFRKKNLQRCYASGIICQISLSRSKFPKFPPLRPGCPGRAMAPVGASSAPRCALRLGTAARAGCRRRGRNCRRRGRRRSEAPSWTLEPWVPLSLTYGKYMRNIWEIYIYMVIYWKNMGNIWWFMDVHI